MSIIKVFSEKLVAIVGVVRTSTRLRALHVRLDLKQSVGELFATARAGLRIDALDRASDAATAEAAYISEGRVMTVMSENARRSVGRYNMPAVWAILPALAKKEPRTGDKSPDRAPRGAPSDDEILKKLKDARALFTYRMRIAWGAYYKCTGATGMADHAFYWAGLSEEVVKGTMERGSVLQSREEELCEPDLLHRTDRPLRKHWLKNGDDESLFIRALELTDAIIQINKAICVYEDLVSGQRWIKRTLRKAKFPGDHTASKALFCDEETQTANSTSFVDKMNIALYTGVNPAFVWPDTINLGDKDPEIELFHGATLVAELAAGRRLKANTAAMRPLMSELLSMYRDLQTQPERISAKTKALMSVDIMLRSVVHSSQLPEIFKAILEREGVISITPMAGMGPRPLSSLNAAGYPHIYADVDRDANGIGLSGVQNGDDIYWARGFWRV
ncbi:hypothetical protein GJ654_12395 [Rhodoblastus acidophilus]|uniref:Uncharacterized protein n=1 Tax=Rhodoblastus acidophilus TaxID=1074 RepID=A0A6N8DPK5_RHOAC|nr:hypothetical protein [Rhodoblastus acidophilus]MCW2275322.1 hypothetical protein [Rhodoblastus acidophilus]MTV31786.1 hypothetical protein [Rhodoblastus acidophilus]